MDRPRWRKVFSDLWGNRMRSLLVIASITVGLFAIGVIGNLYVVIFGDMQAGYSAVNPANIYLNTEGVEQDFIDHLDRLSGVRQIEGVRRLGLRLKSGLDKWTAFDVTALPDDGDIEINQVHLVAGIWPPGDREIVLERNRMASTNAELGDMITLELPSGKTRDLKVVGVVHDLTIGAGGSGSGGFFVAPAQGYIRFSTLEWLEQSETYNLLLATVEGNSEDLASLEAMSQQLGDEMEANEAPVLSSSFRSSYDHPNRSLVDAIVGVLVVLGLLVVFLSGFLITNTLQALLDQQLRQVGIMKTVGAKHLQVSAIYMMMILILGLIGFLIAAPMAQQVSFLLLGLIADQLNFVLSGQRVIYPVLILLGVLALLVPQVAAFFPIWKGSRVSVQEALSGIRQSDAHKRSRIDRDISADLKLRGLSRPLLISIRNTFRRKGRLVLTLVTLTLGGAVFIGTFNVKVSLDQYIELISQYFLADANLDMERPYRIAEISRELEVLPNVALVEGWAGARSELVLDDGSIGESVQLVAPPAGSQLVKPVITDGRWIIPGDRNAITLNDQFRVQFPHLQIGDTLRLRVNGKETEWVVVGFFQFAGKVTGLLAYTNYDYLSELVGQPYQAQSYRIIASDPDKEQADLVQTVENHLRRKGYQIRDVTTGSTANEKSAAGFNVLTAFLLSMAVLTALVGSIGLTGTMSMNVMERTREIGIMRSIGASDRTLMWMVVVEGMLIGLISWVLAALLAFPIGKLMADSINLALFGAPSSFGLTLNGFLIWLVVVIVLSTLASIAPARNAARLTIREVLAYE